MGKQSKRESDYHLAEVCKNCKYCIHIQSYGDPLECGMLDEDDNRIDGLYVCDNFYPV